MFNPFGLPVVEESSISGPTINDPSFPSLISSFSGLKGSLTDFPNFSSTMATTLPALFKEIKLADKSCLYNMKRLAHFYLFHEHHSIEDRCFKINHDIYIYIYTVYLKILVNTSINCKPLKFTTSCNIKGLQDAKRLLQDN